MKDHQDSGPRTGRQSVLVAIERQYAPGQVFSTASVAELTGIPSNRVSNTINGLVEQGAVLDISPDKRRVKRFVLPM